MASCKIQLMLARHFQIGATVFSPRLNGFCMEFWLGCFGCRVWSRGKRLVGFNNYWAG
jgi:hypothetical protein